MYKNEVTVWQEDFLEPKAINAASVSGDSYLVVDGTMGAIVAKVLATDDVSVAQAITVSIKDCDTSNGSFAEVAKASIAVGDYSAGDVMATISIPVDVKKYAKAELTSDTTNTGTVRVTGAYLPR